MTNRDYSPRQYGDAVRLPKTYKLAPRVIEELERLAKFHGVTKSRMVETLVMDVRPEYQIPARQD